MAHHHPHHDTGHLAAHRHGDSSYTHQASPHGSRALGAAVAITGGYAIVELFGGLWSGSLALLADAGHMATDSAALLFAYAA
ncbi:MAG TPA: cation transporter, partial [Burkholderiaceae bacterium]|nr:cation transporter [Burkholderiaceae bacterium]